MPDMEGLEGPRGMLRMVFDHIADGVLVADMARQKFCSCNPKICEMTGYSSAELLSLSVSDIHPPDELPYVVDQFKRQSQREFTLARDVPVKRKDGSVFYADVNAIPMSFEEKDYLVGIFHDITERRNTEKAFQESEEHLRILVDAIPDLVFRLDTDGRFVDYKAEKISQLLVPPEQFLGKFYHEVLPLGISQRVSAAIEDALETGKTQTFEYRLTPPGMAEQFYEARLVAVKGEYCVSICRNITERKEFEEQLKMSAANLRAQGKALEQKNIALKEILAQVESEKVEIGKRVSANVTKLIIPVMHKLKASANSSDKKYLVMLEDSIKTLTSQFSAKIGKRAPSLSSREMEVCNMIRSGLATKEISQIMKVSLRTVDTYRNRTRKKLGISSKDVNLFAHLQKMT